MSWPENVQRFELDTVDSTMSEARRRAADTGGDFWVLAARQTAGTGRRGRAWDTGSGNFSASLLLRSADKPDKLALRSFVAALALHETLVTLTGREAWFALKWPNDVLLRGGKLAGILLESHLDGLVIGIGVNLKSLPPQTMLEPTSVTPKALAPDTGVEISPVDFLDTLAPSFAGWEDRFRTYGFDPIRKAWLDRAAKLGEPISARLPGSVVNGTFETVDAAGAIVLSTADGRRAISAGDVFF